MGWSLTGMNAGTAETVDNKQIEIQIKNQLALNCSRMAINCCSTEKKASTT